MMNFSLTPSQESQFSFHANDVQLRYRFLEGFDENYFFFAFVLSFKMRNEAENDREQMLANIFSFL